MSAQSSFEFDEDALAGSSVLAVLGLFYLWARFVSPVHFLVSLAQPLLLSTALTLLGLCAVRLLARSLASARRLRAFPWQRLSSPLNRGWCFGLPPLLLAGLLLCEVSVKRITHPSWMPTLVDAYVVMLLVMAQSLCRNPNPPAARGASARSVSPTFKAHAWTIAGCLMLTFIVLIGVDTWQTFATPWKPYTLYEAPPPYGHELGYYDSFMSVPDSVVLTRYTRSRREVELVQGTAYFTADYHSYFNSAHWPALVVRAGDARVIVAPSSGGEFDVNAFEIRRDFNRVEVLAYRGQSVSIELPEASGQGFAGLVNSVRTLQPGELAVILGSTVSVRALSEEEQRRRCSWMVARRSVKGPPVVMANQGALHAAGRVD